MVGKSKSKWITIYIYRRSKSCVHISSVAIPQRSSVTVTTVQTWHRRKSRQSNARQRCGRRRSDWRRGRRRKPLGWSAPRSPSRWQTHGTSTEGSVLWTEIYRRGPAGRRRRTGEISVTHDIHVTITSLLRSHATNSKRAKPEDR